MRVRSKASKLDPTGQARNRRVTTSHLVARLNRAERRVKKLFRSIPREISKTTVIVNEQTSATTYSISAPELEDFERQVRAIIDGELLDTLDEMIPLDWYYSDDLELAYRQGTVEEVRDFNALIVGAIAAGSVVIGLPLREIPVESVLFSEPYRADLKKIQVSGFTDIKGLSDKVAAQSLQKINAGMQSKQSATAIAKEITERFKVSRSDAKRIADTEINRAYNNAKLNATELLSEETGLRGGVIHVSALSTTTRPHHADRHGNAYTVIDQTQWWDTGANRINCKCSTTSILIDSKGNVINTDKQERFLDEK